MCTGNGYHIYSAGCVRSSAASCISNRNPYNHTSAADNHADPEPQPYTHPDDHSSPFVTGSCSSRLRHPRCRR